MAETRAPARTISLEEFWTDPSVPEHSEWVRGEVDAMPPVGEEHSEVGGFLIEALRLYVRSKRLGRVLYEPYQLYLPRSGTSRAPDVMVVLGDRLSRIEATRVTAPVDLVVEVLSPESAVRDRRDKRDEYELGGVAEYWLVDPPVRRAEFLRLGADGSYSAVEPVGGRFDSTAVPGFWMMLDWLWDPPLPADLLRAWGL